MGTTYRYLEPTDTKHIAYVDADYYLGYEIGIVLATDQAFVKTDGYLESDPKQRVVYWVELSPDKAHYYIQRTRDIADMALAEMPEFLAEWEQELIEYELKNTVHCTDKKNNKI